MAFPPYGGTSRPGLLLFSHKVALAGVVHPAHPAHLRAFSAGGNLFYTLLFSVMVAIADNVTFADVLFNSLGLNLLPLKRRPAIS